MGPRIELKTRKLLSAIVIGLWAAATWRAMGSPGEINLVELGPGRGTMMVDVLRAARVMPDFLAAIHVHLIEISPALEHLQRNALAGRDMPVSWHRAIEDVPDGPIMVDRPDVGLPDKSKTYNQMEEDNVLGVTQASQAMG